MSNYLPILSISLYLMVACVPKQEAVSINPYKIKKNEAPWIIAHGGAKKLYPGNSLLAFRSSATLGVDMLEMDVRMTKDGILLTHHDHNIDRMSNGKGDLIDYTYKELLTFNFGYNFQDEKGNYPYRNDSIPPCKLSEVFEAFSHMPLMVELKDRGENGKKAAHILKDMISKYKLQDKIVVVAFDENILSYFQEITAGNIQIGTSQEQTKDFVITALSAMEFLYRPKATVVAIPSQNSGINLASRRLINSAHRRNMAVHYWTIDDPAEMKKLISLGADGLITDRPDLMKKVLAEMGY
ncbi:MAG: glycerophosphodiester phosphodiesterase [Bacteroidia bacterium]|nr:glycerophosphodiester phosphodiesterase [Bacteroidia bacterium]